MEEAPPQKKNWLVGVDTVVDVTAEFDSWYEESFLGGVSVDGPPGGGTPANVAHGKPDAQTAADTCVR